MITKLVWVTPEADDLIAYMARVSAPENQANVGTAPRLIAYCLRQKHWSIFEMVDMCVEITTERDISRQLLRHGKAFRFQEFSQRYASVGVLPPAMNREARMQDKVDRQNSIACEDDEVKDWWNRAQTGLRTHADGIYTQALSKGIAKEVARSVLPEGLTTTRLYMKSDVRSWLHFCDLRMGNGTQKETKEVATGCWELLRAACPKTTMAWELVSKMR